MIIWIDCETTSLNPDLGAVWELSYAIDDSPVFSSMVRHKLEYANVDALRIGGYTERYTNPSGPTEREARAAFETAVKTALVGATFAGANPAFDAAFLRTRWRGAPWKYRLLDVETYAMAAMGLDEPPGLAVIAEHLGIVNPAPHTAAGDVETARACYRKLRDTYQALYTDPTAPSPAAAPSPSDVARKLAEAAQRHSLGVPA